MMIKYNDEPDLQRKIAKKLNLHGFNFIKTKSNYFCDLVDQVHKIYIEVKPDNFAPAQLLYGLAQNQLRDAEYLALACAYEIRFYVTPRFEKIMDFAMKIDPLLQKNPSSVNQKQWNDLAFELIGKFDLIYPYPFNEALDLTKKEKFIFIDENNYEYFKALFTKYNINPAQFLTYISEIYSSNNSLTINNKGLILETNSGTFYHNSDQSQRKMDLEYRPIKDIRDKELFESTRLKPKAVGDILHKIDTMESIKSRRDRGRYFTEKDFSTSISELVMDAINPEFIIEACCGGGSLVRTIVAKTQGIMNDINKGFVDNLEKEFSGSNWKFTHFDLISTSIADLLTAWQIPPTKKFIFFTNPPFGTISTNQTASKTEELMDKNDNKKKISRNKSIDYFGLDKIYGKGDLILPIFGKIIELVKSLGKGYIAIFSPLDVFCLRNRYKKLLTAILKDFKFLEGYVFSGEQFNGVSKNKPIAFTLWEYARNTNTTLDTLSFLCDEKMLYLQALPCLKDYWKYDTRVKIHGEIIVQGNDRFNASGQKRIIHITPKKGGSELVPENVKKELHIPNLPTELCIGLWSCTVGWKAIVESPFYINACYTHLPDFKNPITQEILTYSLMYMVISELLRGITNNKIGFIGNNRIFKFGDNPRLTEGATFLLTTYTHLSMGEKTIGEVFHTIQNQPNATLFDPNYRKQITKEIEHRLDQIAYWKYLPIPE